MVQSGLGWPWRKSIQTVLVFFTSIAMLAAQSAPLPSSFAGYNQVNIHHIDNSGTPLETAIHEDIVELYVNSDYWQQSGKKLLGEILAQNPKIAIAETSANSSQLDNGHIELAVNYKPAQTKGLVLPAQYLSYLDWLGFSYDSFQTYTNNAIDYRAVFEDSMASVGFTINPDTHLPDVKSDKPLAQLKDEAKNRLIQSLNAH
jgi:hypothetical protein